MATACRSRLELPGGAWLNRARPRTAVSVGRVAVTPLGVENQRIWWGPSTDPRAVTRCAPALRAFASRATATRTSEVGTTTRSGTPSAIALRTAGLRVSMLALLRGMRTRWPAAIDRRNWLEQRALLRGAQPADGERARVAIADLA